MRHLIFSILLFPACLHAFEFDVSYEPFLIQRLGEERTDTYQAGSYISNQITQSKDAVLLHLVSLRVRQSWQVPWGSAVGIESGVSATPLSSRLSWSLSPADSSFSGTVTRPISPASSDNFFGGASLGFSLDGTSRYMVEDYSMAYVPVALFTEKKFQLFGFGDLGIRMSAGFEFLQILLERQKTLSNSLAIDQHSGMFLAQHAGASFDFGVPISEEGKFFINLGINGVDGVNKILNTDGSASGTYYGYRFDGLRYNAKLGVSWKL